MKPVPNLKKDKEPESMKLRVEYWTMRHSNTAASTESSSRLMYYIDGAVLALVYFVIDKLGAGRQIILVMSFPMFVLAIINYLHSEFIFIQHNWQKNIDKRLLDILGEPEVRPSAIKGFHFSSSHGIYRAIHVVIALSLLISAILMVFYGLGNFPDLY
jgi:hypothetical protein